MDIDNEIHQRLKDTEDHFTERKESAQKDRIPPTPVFDPKIATLTYKPDTLEIAFKNGQAWQLFAVQQVMQCSA
jgi:hypothetical protein